MPSTPLRLFGVLLLSVTLAHADVRLPAILSDHMVLQAGKPVPIWGWAAPGEKVSVAFAGQKIDTTTGENGRWSVRLAALTKSSVPAELSVKGNNALTVRDVLVGEAWLCSGQSNMEMQLKGLHGQVDNADQEIAAANYPLIRMFQFREVYDIYKLPVPPHEPQADRAGDWIICTPQTAAKFIALGYFFARELHRELGGAPIGLVHSSVGGTPIEAWTSLPAQQAVPELQAVLSDWKKRLSGYDAAEDLKKYNEARTKWEKARDTAKSSGQAVPKAPAAFKNLLVSEPAGLFNGMIQPLLPYAIRGVLWYQGERNSAGPLTGYYGLQLKTLVADWRAQWSDNLYFAWVQLPNYTKLQKNPSEPNGWGVWVRDGQRQALAVPNTAMAVTIDLANETAGHPTNKAPYSHRLALLALHDVYGKSIPVWSGPLYRSSTRDGDRMVLTFDHSSGLHARSGDLAGFALAGADKKFVWAQARVENDRVVVSSPQVKDPVAVRYSWAANPLGNLVNAADLPASPFASDDGK